MNIGKETEFVEFKKSKAELKEAMQSIAAILNKHGHGELYFGVDNEGNVVGQEVGPRTTREISQAISTSIEPRVYADINELTADDSLSYIKVSFKGDERPYSCKGVYRIRVADEDLTMSTTELESQMMERLNRREPWDTRTSQKTISNIVPGAVKRFVAKGNERDRITEEYTNDADVLASIGLILENDKLTNAAATLFCKGGSPFRLTMGVLDGNTRTKILDLHQEDGPVFDLIDKAEHFVISNIRRRLVFGNGVARDEIPEIPRSAVREGIINAFCHRDYTDVAAVVIDVFTDTVEITNPGLFPTGKTPEAFIAGKVKPPSRGRNPLIANALFRSGLIEQYGSGIGRIRDACAEANVKFEYRQDDDCTTLVFHRPGSHLENESKFGPGGIAKDDLSNREQLALELAAKDGKVTTGSFAKAAGISRQAAAPVLKRLAEDGLLLWQGKNVQDPHQHYVLTAKH